MSENGGFCLISIVVFRPIEIIVFQPVSEHLPINMFSVLSLLYYHKKTWNKIAYNSLRPTFSRCSVFGIAAHIIENGLGNIEKCVYRITARHVRKSVQIGGWASVMYVTIEIID